MAATQAVDRRGRWDALRRRLSVRPDLLVCAAGLAALLLAAEVAPARIVLDAPLFLFLPVIAAAAFWRGPSMGLCLAALGLAVGLWLGPARGFSGGGAIALYAATAVLLSVAGAWAVRRRRERDDAAHALAEREAQLRSIFDTTPEALIVINQAGIIQTSGRSAERMFGWRQSELVGRNISMLMPEPYSGQHDSYLARYAQTGEKRIIGIGRIVTGKRKDGSTFPMELAVGEVGEGTQRVFTGFVRDITERRESEARLQELQAELVHISRLSAMGEMASALAHELNQPLSAIANYLSGARKLIGRPENEAKVGDALAKANEQALRAGDIIRRLRDFLARGEGERSVESLAKLVHEACGLALLGAKESGVAVSYRIDARLDRVIVDRIQIEQVIVNLVRNALDAMRDQVEEHKPARLEIATAVEGPMATVSIADSGPGLDEQVAARLFQPFVTTKAQGMGVGLSICRTIVEAHGGRIWAEANAGGGAIFRFTVPLAEDEDP